MKLIFIHGAGHTGELWSDLLALFPGALAPSLPGHPESEALATVDACAEWLVRTHLADEPAVLIGNSMGGAVAMTVALAEPQRVAGLVLVGTGARLRVHPDFFTQLEGDFAAAARTLAQLELAPDAPESRVARIVAAMERCGPATTITDFRACDAFDARERVGAIARPTLIVSGTEDRMTPPKFSEFLLERIQGAKLESLEGAGHVPQLEQPERVGRAIGAFVAALGEEASARR